ncbi:MULTISPECIES: lasso peptide biosynthesis PqqD family chaperone [unclassified Sutcliffiella]|uniref:lasso peptide biosynthesis PqqD family chaperone n=1 Tax=unclassified Sutcliffiella TaxID=2837532 RepID=UPI0030D098D8
MGRSETLSQNQVISQVEGNIVSDMDGEKVMFSITNGKYYNLGEIGGVIWDLIENQSTLESIVQELMKQYDVDHELCENQVMTFMDMLYGEGLISVVTK